MSEQPESRTPSYQWRRFWISRESSLRVDGDGFLDRGDDAWGRSANPDAKSLDELTEAKCLVLLGEPGMGKSTCVNSYQAADPSLAYVADLATFESGASVTDEVFHSSFVQRWLATDDPLTLWLDSLDEAEARAPKLHALLLRRLEEWHSHWPVLKLRLVSRTAQWPLWFEEGLGLLFGPGNVSVCELQPLRRQDAVLAAQVEGVDGEAFLGDVRRAGAGPLAARPVTLRTLIGLYKERAALPSDRAELFELGCRRLCEEPDRRRADAGEHGTDELMVVAGRLAAATCLCDAAAFRIGADDEAPTGMSAMEPGQLTGGVEPARRQAGSIDEVQVTESLIRDVLRTALFSSRGPGRMGWAHRTYSEYLCARYLLSDHDIGAERAMKILSVSDAGHRHVVPQLASVAAHCADLDPAFLQALISADPQAAVAEPIQVPQASRPSLVDSLLRAYDEGRIPRGPIFFEQLKVLFHDGLADQLRPYLSSSHDERAREIAVDLAAACRVTGLVPELLELALPAETRAPLRIGAAHAVATIADRDQRARLVDLLDLDPAQDPQDELKGCALEALWPGVIDAQRLFAALTRPRVGNLYGLYAAFLHDDPMAPLAGDDFVVALDWLVGNEWAIASLGASADLAESILSGAVRASEAASVRERLAAALVELSERAAAAGRLTSLPAFVEAVWDDEPRRRRLAASVLDAAVTSGKDAAILLSFDLNMVQAADLEWIVEELRSSPDTASRAAWSELAARVFYPESATELSAVVEACGQFSELQAALSYWLDPVELSSDSAVKQRERWHAHTELELERAQPEELPRVDADGVHERLDLCERVPEAFARLTYDLVGPERGAGSADVLDPDLRTLPGWPAAETTRSRIVTVAKAYLQTGDPDPEGWLGTTRLSIPALAGYKALRLLQDEDPSFVSDHEHDLMTRWVSIVVGYPISRDPPESAPRTLLTSRSYAAAGDEYLRCVEVLLRSEGEVGLVDEVLRLLTPVFDERIEGWLLGLQADTALPVACRGAIVRYLVERGSAAGIDLARACVAQSGQAEAGRDLAVRASIALLTRDAEGAWPEIWTQMQADPDFGRALAFVAAHHEIPPRTQSFNAALSPQSQAQLFVWLVAQFPFDQDEAMDGVGSMTPRRYVEWWRDALIGNLREAGRPGSADAVHWAQEQLSEIEWLHDVELRARQAERRQSWVPLTPREMLELVGDPGARSVSTESDLLEIIIEAVALVQARLHGETPMVRFLWNELPEGKWKPKLEPDLSDWIADGLKAQLQERRVVVNREVEISRTSGRGAGSQTDIHATATRDGASPLRVIVELKGCWNREVESAMQSQLVDNYMAHADCSAGLYIVGWYGCSDSSNCPGQRTLCSRMTLPEAGAFFDQQALALTSELRVVRALILDARRSY